MQCGSNVAQQSLVKKQKPKIQVRLDFRAKYPAPEWFHYTLGKDPVELFSNAFLEVIGPSRPSQR
jgi:hypothetical protein